MVKVDRICPTLFPSLKYFHIKIPTVLKVVKARIVNELINLIFTVVDKEPNIIETLLVSPALCFLIGLEIWGVLGSL
jgi:hypothetical protein